MVQWTRSTVTVKHTDMVDSPELERGVTITSMAKDLPRLKLLASFP